MKQRRTLVFILSTNKHPAAWPVRDRTMEREHYIRVEKINFPPEDAVVKFDKYLSPKEQILNAFWEDEV